ncbi:pentapeptide repeat-containing protein [Rhodococcus sp. NPDC055112]
MTNPTPTNHTDCPGVNFEESELPGLNLAYANLGGARLKFTNLVGANLTGANLASAEMTGAKLNRADLTGANLTGSVLMMAQAVDANLTNANLSEARMSNANLSRAKLSGANFWHADINGVHLDQTILVPSDQRAVADPATGTAVVSWPTPPVLNGTWLESCDRESGSSFPVGVTTVRCTFKIFTGKIWSSAVGKFTVTVQSPILPTISGSPWNASVGQTFQFQFDVAGNPQPEITTTSVLPPGITLSQSGVLSGIPTQVGTFPLTLAARSEAGESTFTTQLVVTDDKVPGPAGSSVFGS